MKQFIIVTIINIIIALTSSAVMPEALASQPVTSAVATSTTKVKGKKKTRKKRKTRKKQRARIKRHASSHPGSTSTGNSDMMTATRTDITTGPTGAHLRTITTRRPTYAARHGSNIWRGTRRGTKKVSSMAATIAMATETPSPQKKHLDRPNPVTMINSCI